MSIKTCILAFFGVLVAAALASAASVMAIEFSELSRAVRAGRLTRAFDALLTAQTFASRERGDTNVRLLGAAGTPLDAGHRAETGRAFDAALEAIKAAAPDRTMLPELERVRDAFMVQRAAAAWLAHGTVRDIDAADYVRQNIALMDRLDRMADQIERAASASATPLVRSYIEQARLAATLRDWAGRRGSFIARLATASAPVTPEVGEALGEGAGEVRSVWRRLDQVAEVSRQIAAAAGAPPADDLTATIQRARQDYVDGIEAVYRQVVTAARAGTPTEVQPLRQRQLDTLVLIGVIREVALKHAAAAAADDERAARLELAEVGALLLLVGAGTIGAALFLHRRVIAPMAGLTAIVSRLAENRRDDAVPALERGDEIGRLARAIETLRRALEHASQVERERQAMELQLRQAQKLESLGTLAGGIAHEINTPVQYIGDNVRFLVTCFADLVKVVDGCRALRDAVADEPRFAALATTVAEAETAADLGFLRDEVPAAIAQSLDGIERIRQIVLAVKEFSHPDVKEATPLDLNHAIETTVTVSRNQWKYVAELTTELDPGLPPVPCRGGEINQVILNLIVNAAHAIEAKGGGIGRITVTSGVRDGSAEIRVRDTGIGMSAELIDRIFDPFFTTKALGKGTGQGLAICHTIVVQKHGGAILVDSTPGEGSCFTVRLPLQPPPAPAGELGLAAARAASVRPPAQAARATLVPGMGAPLSRPAPSVLCPAPPHP